MEMALNITFLKVESKCNEMIVEMHEMSASRPRREGTTTELLTGLSRGTVLLYRRLEAVGDLSDPVQIVRHFDVDAGDAALTAAHTPADDAHHVP